MLKAKHSSSGQHFSFSLHSSQIPFDESENYKMLLIQNIYKYLRQHIRLMKSWMKERTFFNICL